MFFSKAHIYFLSFAVLTLFVIIIANFSQYYIPLGVIIFPTLFIVFLFLFFHDLLDINRTYDTLIYFLICLFVFCFHTLLSFQLPNIRLLIDLFFACSFLYMKDDARFFIYDKFIRILALLLFLSLIEYFLYHIGVSFIIGTSVRPKSDWTFFQGLLNLFPIYRIGFCRFHFITEEPGYIGTLLFFIIATLNREKYKKEYFIFFISGIITFSLAFYLLILLWSISSLKLSNFKFLLVPLVLYGAFYESINNLIVDRVVYKYEDGTLDNRNQKKVLQLYDEMWENGQIVIGMGNRAFQNLDIGSGSGVKRFIIHYGLFGFLLVFTSFTYVFFRYNKVNYSNVVLLLLFWFSFYQRCDLNLETNIVILYSYGIVGKKRDLLQIGKDMEYES